MNMNLKIQIPNSEIIIFLAKCFATDNVVKAIEMLISNPDAKLGRGSVYSCKTNYGYMLSDEEVADTKRYMEMFANMNGKECWVDFMT